MAIGGKVGGRGGGPPPGGKGGGGKGKKGGGCQPGDIVILAGLPLDLFEAVKNAFNSGVTDPGTTDVTVRLECNFARTLLFALAADIGTNFVRKKPKGNGKKGGK